MLAGLGGILKTAVSSNTITLSGTSGSPNVASATAISPDNCFAEWILQTDGTIDKNTTTGSSQFQTGIEWDSDQPTPAATYYVRATADTGDAPTSGSGTGTWLALTTQRTWRWTEVRNGFFSKIGAVKLEIDTVGDGSNIVATGYYRGSASVEL